MAERKAFLSEALLLTTLPFLGYLYATAYEWGYLSQFGVPYWLISVSAKQSIAVLALALLMAMASGLLLFALPKGPWLGIINQGLPLLSPPFFFNLVLLQTDWASPWSVRLLAFAAIVLIPYWAALFTRRIILPLRTYEGTWLERWSQAADKDVKRARGDAGFAVMEAMHTRDPRAGVWILMAWLALVMFPLGYHALGQNHAKHDTSFEVVDREPACILLRDAGTHFICADLDPTQHRLTGVVRLLEANDAHPLVWRKRKLHLIGLGE